MQTTGPARRPRFRGADGQYRWFNVRGEPLRASDGTVLRWYGVLIDIDEAKKAEDLLRRSDALATTRFNDDTKCLSGCNGEIDAVNDARAALLIVREGDRE